MLSVYLAGEIHSNWREEIIQLCQKEKLEVQFSSPITNHENSDNCGVEILGAEEKNLTTKQHVDVQENDRNDHKAFLKACADA